MSSDAPGVADSSVLAAVVGPEGTTRRSYVAELAVLGSVLFASGGHLLIKAGLNAAAKLNAHAVLWQRLLHYFLQPVVILGLGVYGLGTLLWVLAVSKKSVSYLFPITALNYVLVTLGGKMFLGEVIPPGRWLGILAVVFGVTLMFRSATGESK